MDSNICMNLHGAKVAKTGRMIGFGALSLLTGVYCAEPCSAALLHVMGAVSAARLASSTIFIVTVAAASLGLALWRVYRTQRTCDDGNCLSARSMWSTSIFLVTAFVLDVLV